MQRETLEYIVVTLRTMQANLTTYELQPQITALREENADLVERLRGATEREARTWSECEAFRVTQLELRRQITEQSTFISKLERQIEDTEFQRGILETELRATAVKYDNLFEDKQGQDMAFQELEAQVYLLTQGRQQNHESNSDNGNETTETNATNEYNNECSID